MNNFAITNLIIEIITILSIISALAVITSTNPVIAIIFLIGLFLNVAIYLIFMGLNFIGLSYLLVYIGAITVLILFIVMMISTEVVQTVEVGPDYSKLLPLAYSLAVLFLILFLITIPSFIIDFSSFEIYNLINNLIYYIKNDFSNLLDYSSVQNLFNLSTNNNKSGEISEALTNSINTQFNYGPFGNYFRNIYVEYNPLTYPLIKGNNNPTGFYYWHPSVTEQVKLGLDNYNLNTNPFLFPLGWYADEPYNVYLNWVSNKNINVFLSHNININPLFDMYYLPYYNISVINKFYNILFSFSPWINTDYGYTPSSVWPWYWELNNNYSTYFFKHQPEFYSLENFYLGLTWLNILKFPEFLFEFPQSPVYSPEYFIGTKNAFGEVYHIIEKYNNINSDLLFTNTQPATLLHKNLQIVSLGQSIYGHYSILLILSSVLLLLAMVCPIILSRNENKH
jgi:NADH-ubiquinone oxidoreductase chain 6